MQILNGPVIQVRLKANVTMPDMEISDDTLDFSEVKCGECKVITVQLYNQQQVKCEWNSLPTEKELRKVSLTLPEFMLSLSLDNSCQQQVYFNFW